MKAIRVMTKTLFFVFLVCFILLFSLMFYLRQNLSDNYKIPRGKELEINAIVPVTATFEGVQSSRSLLQSEVGETFPVDLKLFGTIPLSTVQVEIIDEMYVAVLGHPFGMKLYTDGVLVIDTSAVDGSDGSVNPSEKAGLKKGDYILSADGVQITCNEDLSELVSASSGETIRLDIIRNGKKKTLRINAVYSSESEGYRLGVWVRDSSAGIGTLTFYSPSTEVLCGLGHGICDEDTGSLMSLDSGEMVSAKIVSAQVGKKGSPGELKGSFTYEALADIELNAENGVYGILKGNIDLSNLTEVALKQEIEDGEAQILCTVDGEEPQLYACTVQKRNSGLYAATQNLTVKITDPDLIAKTGGIVQGMSGSPILQNGRLIGAITHVLVDDPTTGYAIFAENMLETAQTVANENKLKDAS